MKLMMLLLVGALSCNAVMAQSLAENHELPDALTAVPGHTVKQASFFDNHVLVFFFASTCPHCHEQAPVLARWAEEFGARIDARSFDDKPLPGFENQHPVTKDLVDVAFSGNPIRYPALFVMNEATGALYPASIGSLNATELQTRMNHLIPKIMQYEQEAQA